MDAKEFKSKMKDPSYKYSFEAYNEIQETSFKLAKKAKIHSNFRLIICIEELSELTKCLTKVLRYGLKGDKKKVNKYMLLEEFADVKLCMDVIQRVAGFTDEEVLKAMGIKIQELKRRDDELIAQLEEEKKEEAKAKAELETQIP